MTALAWLTILAEVLLAIWVIRLVWRTETDRPTEEIVPAGDDDVELVGLKRVRPKGIRVWLCIICSRPSGSARWR